MTRASITHRFVVNEHLDVAWDEKEERVQVLVDGDPVLHCAFLVASVSPSDEEVTSIDDLAGRKEARRFEGKNVRDLLTIEEEVLAHASNIQAWAEHDYDTRLLHSNIAFTLLKTLAKVGDQKAKRVLDAELSERIRDGTPATRIAILESCGELLDHHVFVSLLDEIPFNKRTPLWINLGVALDISGNIRGAIDAYRNAIAIKPDHADAWNNLGNALDVSGDAGGAIAAYGKAIAIKPDHAGAWYNLGIALVASGDVKGAIDAYRKAIAIKPDHAGAWNNLGVALNASGDVNGAIDAYHKAIAIKPDDVDAWYDLGIALVASGDVKGAIDAYRKAIAIKPDYADAWTNLGVAVQASGNVNGAIDAYRKAIAIKPDHAGAWNNLGFALDVSGAKDEAILAFRKALELDPTKKYTIEYLQRLGKPIK